MQKLSSVAIPVTSMHSERLFSAAGHIVSKRKTCLNLENVDVEQKLKSNNVKLDCGFQLFKNSKNSNYLINS